MADAWLLTLAIAADVVGFAWLALAMEHHWHQVRGGQPLRRRTAVVLRGFGSGALLASLGLCLAADHASMAALVWVMALAAAAVVVAFTFAYRPRLFAPLVAAFR